MVLYLSDSDVTMVILLSVVAMCWCGAVVKICEYSSVVLFTVHISQISKSDSNNQLVYVYLSISMSSLATDAHPSHVA